MAQISKQVKHVVGRSEHVTRAGTLLEQVAPPRHIYEANKEKRELHRQVIRQK